MTNSIQKKESEQTESAYIYACLPVPPSVNHYWLPCKGSNKRRISPEGKVYRMHVACLVGRIMEGFFIKQKHEIGPEECLSITGEYFVPDNRRRDLDNILKSLFDSFTDAKLWHDDVQISEIHFVKVPHSSEFPKGAILLTVRPFKS